MKKIKVFLTVSLLALFSMSINAQDFATATEAYNAGAAALGAQNYSLAISSFEKSVSILSALDSTAIGEDGMKMLKDTKALLPKICLQYGKKFATDKNLDSASTYLKKSIDLGEKYSVPEVVTEAKELLPQLAMADANGLLNEGKYADAIVEYEKILVSEPENGTAYLRIGICNYQLKNYDASITAFEKAISLGEAEQAKEHISNAYLQKSLEAFNSKNWKETLAFSKKSCEYNPNETGYRLMGASAFTLKNYDETIAASEKYISIAPNAKDKSNYLYYMATSFEAKGNKAKACGYYKLLLNDPKFKAAAEHKIKNELKCK